MDPVRRTRERAVCRISRDHDGPRGAGDCVGNPVIVTEPEGTLRDTLTRLSFAGNFGRITAGLADAEIWVASPIQDQDMITFAPDGSSGVVVKRQSWDGRPAPAEFEVTRIDLHGDTVYRRSFEHEPRPVPPDFFDDRIASSLDGPSINNRNAHARALREFYQQHRYFPPVVSVVVGNDGTTWLAGLSEEDGGREWLVLDGSGSGIGRFRLAGGILFADLTECWVVERDAFDIPYVVQYDIVR